MERENTFDQFRKSIKKVTGTRVHKITKSLGVYDIYKYIRKNKWFDIGRPVTEHEFYSIIRTMNNYMAEALANGQDVYLPNRMGRLEIRKTNAFVAIKNNRIITNRPIDWDRTLKLWYEDQEAFNNKTLVKEESNEIYKVYYNKNKAEYNNKSFFDFNVNRDIKSRLKQNVRKGKISAFLCGRI